MIIGYVILSSGSVYDTDMTDVLLSAPTELCWAVNVNNTLYLEWLHTHLIVFQGPTLV